MMGDQRQETDSSVLTNARREDWRMAMTAGARLMAEGRPLEAAGEYRAAHEAAPEELATTLNLAAALHRSGSPQEALAVYAALTKTHPAHAGVHHVRGLALHALGDRAGALDAFREAVRHDPNAWKSWGSVADTTPDEDERIYALQQKADALLRICDAASDRPAPIHDCATALIDAHRYAAAAGFVAHHAEDFLRPSTSYDLLARIAYYRGDFQEALAHKRQAFLAIRPEDIPSPAAVPAFNPRAAIGALRDICDILTGAGVRHFLAAGTLLGFVRGGGPLAHDRDVDIGVLQSDDAPPDIAALLRSHPALLMPASARSGDRYFGFSHKGVAVDIFIHKRTGEHFLCGVSDTPGDVQWRFSAFDLVSADFNGLTWTIPHDSHRYLEESYGRGWSEPDTGFASAISSPALYEVDPFARAYYSAARARKMLACGKIEKADALLRQSPVPLTEPIACVDRWRTVRDAPTNIQTLNFDADGGA